MAERLFHTDYPIYSLSEVGPGQFMIGGGGGGSKCGIPNVVELYSICRRGESESRESKSRYSVKLTCRKELEREVMWHLERHGTDTKLLTGSLSSKCTLIFLGNLPTRDVDSEGVPAPLPVIEFKGEVGAGGDLRHKQARFSPKGDLLATVTTENVIRLWTLPQLEPCGILEGHTSEVSDISFHPDGSKLVSLGEDNVIRVWLVETFSELFKVQWPVEGDREGSGAKENCRNCRVVSVLDKKTKLNRGLLFTTHNKVGPRQRGSTIVQWDLDLGGVVASKRTGPHPLCALEVCPEAELLAVGNVEGQIRVYSMSSLGFLRGIQAHSVSITSMRFLSLPIDSKRGKKQEQELILLTTSIDRTCCATRCSFRNLRRWLYFILLPLIFLVLAYFLPHHLRDLFY